MSLSHSKVAKYLQCPTSYKHYYVSRLREKTATAFLAFGSAMDKAFNSVLESIKNKTELPNYKETFDAEWQKITINNRTYSLADCALVGYAKSDFVYELLQPLDISFIEAKAEELMPDRPERDVQLLRDALESWRSQRAFKHFPKEAQRLLNVMNYVSMRRKAHLMLDAYVRDVVPQIEDVRSIQQRIELESDDDGLVGYADAIVKFKHRPDYVVMDNKTSASMYDEDSVRTSEQLSLYAFALGLKHGAYAVMSKNIKLNKVKICLKCNFNGSGGSHKTCYNEIAGKRCGAAWNETYKPEAVTQLIVDSIAESTQSMIVENIGEVANAIKMEVFPKNTSACHNIYGSPCPYMKLCWEGKDEDLEKV